MIDGDSWLGSILADRYEIQGELGRGGMAVVYRARDRKLDRPVAIKVMGEDFSGSMGSERFDQEIRVLSGLSHPNIVGLNDSGEMDGALFYVMPLVEGESLRARLEREGSLPLEDARAITLDVARALTHAHALGIVHRDIKPENILLSGGSALLADFGIAKALDATDTGKLTATGTAIGTVTYMSPEQAMGSEGVDARTDQYALASVLYEMLAGEPPFWAATPQAVLARKSMEVARPLRPVRETVSPAFEEVVLRALSRHPADRFPAIHAFSDQLTAVPLRATQEEMVVAPSATRQRGRRGARAALAVVVVAMATSAAWWIARPTGSRRATSADPVRLAILPCTTPEVDQDVVDRVDVMVGRLQEVPEIVPVVSSATERLAAAGLDPARVADTLHADAVARCRTAADGPAIAVTAADGRDLAVVPLTDHDEEVAFNLLRAVGVSLTDDVRAAVRSYTSGSRVADSLYRISRHYQAMANDAMTDSAIVTLRGAVAADSLFAAAWAGLSIAHTNRYRDLGDRYDPAVERRAAARTAQTAVRLNPRLAESHLAMGFAQAWLDLDLPGAEASFRRALALSPNHPVGLHGMAFVTAWRGARDSAAMFIDRALDFAPLDQLTVLTHGFIYYLIGRYAEAADDFRWVNETATDAPATGLLVWALIEGGALDEARRVASSSCPAGGTARECSIEAYVRAAAGDRAWITDWARRYRADVAAGRYADAGKTSWTPNDDFQLAEYYAMLGMADSAFTYLDAAWRGGSAFLIRFRVDPHFRRLRSDPRFEELAARIGLPPIPDR